MPTTKSNKTQNEEDEQLVDEVIALAKSGAPWPEKGTRLGDALIRRFAEDASLDAELIARAKSGAAPQPRKGARLGDLLARRFAKEDASLAAELLALAKSRAPQPKKGTRLGDALIRFTTPPTTKKTSAKCAKLSEVDRLQIAATGIKRQRPNYLAKGERRRD